MKLIIFYFTENLGTTDFYLEYLRNKGEKYYYFRHPFYFEKSLNFSELVYYDGKKERIISRYKKIKNPHIELIKNIILNFYISVRLFFRISSIIGFGGFNIFSSLCLRLFGKKLIFWGVDYSRKRFENRIMNEAYLLLETFACIFSSKIISSSKRQEEARIRFHYLDEKKSIIISNGVKEIKDIEYNFNKHAQIAFIYVGSITHQHGIIEFLRYFYEANTLQKNIYIFGGGEEEKQLQDLVKKINSKYIHYYGRKSQEEIGKKINESQDKLWGIAPYSDTLNDHVYYGDSIKIREYLNYGVPYISTKIVYISTEFEKYGMRILKYNDIDFDKLKDFIFSHREAKMALEKYTWDNLYKEI